MLHGRVVDEERGRAGAGEHEGVAGQRLGPDHVVAHAADVELGERREYELVFLGVDGRRGASAGDCKKDTLCENVQRAT